MINLILARLPDILAFAFVAEWAIRLTRWFYRTLGTVVRHVAAPGLPAGDVQADMIKRGLALPWEVGAAAKERRRAFWCGRK